MSLYTGKDIHSFYWVELPINDYIVKMIEELVNVENSPVLINIQCLIGHQ